MKPRTANEKEVTMLSKRLKPLTKAQEQWINRYAVPTKAYQYRKLNNKELKYEPSVMAWCSNCGQSFLDEPKVKKCPHCGAPITAHEYRPQKKLSNGRWYTTIITTCAGWQVSRHYLVDHYCRKDGVHGNPAFEAVQIWTNELGEQVIIARSVRPLCGYYDAWNFQSEMTVKHKRDCYDYKYNIASHASKVCRVLPILKRNGFKGKLHDFSPDDLWPSLLKSNEAEMLFKSGQYQLLYRMIRRGDYTIPYRHAVLICNRNRYIVSDADMWYDYLQLLDELGLDTHNAHYVCPKDLNAAHDQLVAKKNKIISELQEKAYKKHFSKFLGIKFGNKHIVCSVLQSVKEFEEEGKAMHHCVYSNGYYDPSRHKNSLILSAKDRYGNRIETVEVNFKSLRVVQCRGKHNKPTKKHKQIIDLVNNNMGLIKKAIL